MFKKSALAGAMSDPPYHGTIVFNGYAEVRETPKNPPPLLKQKIKTGKDIIAIWFQHVHAERFKDLEEWDDVKIIGKGLFREQSLLPKIEEMTGKKILEFCKSIDVHPAHLVPFDRDVKLSLPMPLLELLVEMACPDISGEYYDQYDVYLAKGAIAFECKRIRDHLRTDQLMPASIGQRYATFSQAFASVLNHPLSTNNMATAKMSPSKSFGIHASCSYPYIDRVLDLAVIQADNDYVHSHNRVDAKREVISERIKGFIKVYKKYINPQVSDDIEGEIFLDDVVKALAEKEISKDTSTIEKIGDAIQGLLGSHIPYHLHYKTAHSIFAEKFGVRTDNQSVDDEEYLQALDDPQLEDLAGAVQHIFNSEANLVEAEEKHNNCAKDYLRVVEDIHENFNLLGSGYERNLVNNRVLLGVHNISIKKVASPTLYPR